MAMEALSSILKRAMLRGIIQGFLASGRGAVGMEVSHFLFANDTLIFCDSNIQHLEYLSWAFTWLEAISGLKTNLDKSELIPVEQVSKIKDLAREVGCKVGSLPSTYLSLPLGASFKSLHMWDVVEKRFHKKLVI